MENCFLNQHLFIHMGGCPPPKVVRIPTKTRIGHPHVDKQGFINPGSTSTGGLDWWFGN